MTPANPQLMHCAAFLITSALFFIASVITQSRLQCTQLCAPAMHHSFIMALPMVIWL
jgi:hypothetical protein